MIGHFDADAFFASVEQAADGRLRRRPVAVGGSGARGVVCSASYEARAYGVRSAMPTRQALQLCPELVVVRGHFELYEEFSARIFGWCEALTPRVERSSIDEGYLDLGGGAGGLAGAVRALRELDRTIRGELKITVSCALALRKGVARIASKARKPHGFTVVPAGSEAAFLAPLAVAHLTGIGPAAAARLAGIGLRTIGDLVQAGADRLYPMLGRRTAGLLELARGEGDEPVVTDAPPAQSFSGQETLARESGDEAVVEQALKGLLTAQLRRLRAARHAARTLVVGLRYSDRETAQAAHSLAAPGSIDADFLPHIRPLLRRAWRRRVTVNQVRLELSRLYPDWMQGELFGPGRPRQLALCRLGDALTARFGPAALRPASQLPIGKFI